MQDKMTAEANSQLGFARRYHSRLTGRYVSTEKKCHRSKGVEEIIQKAYSA